MMSNNTKSQQFFCILPLYHEWKITWQDGKNGKLTAMKLTTLCWSMKLLSLVGTSICDWHAMDMHSCLSGTFNDNRHVQITMKIHSCLNLILKLPTWILQTVFVTMQIIRQEYLWFRCDRYDKFRRNSGILEKVDQNDPIHKFLITVGAGYHHDMHWCQLYLNYVRCGSGWPVVSTKSILYLIRSH